MARATVSGVPTSPLELPPPPVTAAVLVHRARSNRSPWAAIARSRCEPVLSGGRSRRTTVGGNGDVIVGSPVARRLGGPRAGGPRRSSVQRAVSGAVATGNWWQRYLPGSGWRPEVPRPGADRLPPPRRLRQPRW